MCCPIVIGAALKNLTNIQKPYIFIDKNRIVMDLKKHTLVIVEDDPGLQKQLKWSLDNFDIQVADERIKAMELIREYHPGVVITDLGLPPDPGGNSEGFALVSEILAFDHSIKVIVVTGREEKDNAVKAIGLGAYDFYNKPIDVDTLKFVVQRAFRLVELENENIELLHSRQVDTSDGLIGTSTEMQEITKLVDKVAPTSANILILGESGTGKGLLTKMLHAKSDRAEQRLVTINCSSIPESLLESELFGHEKGAFTGAVAKKIGKIEYAEGGTLFLDEIGDMPFQLQAKILHVLQERKIVRLGGNVEIPLDIRVVCATHQNLDERIKDGLFREDLFYRISEITIDLPPLRDRNEDVVILAHSFLQKFSKQNNVDAKKFSDDALEAIRNYPWPGNVREMENKIKRAILITDTPAIKAVDLGLEDQKEQEKEERFSFPEELGEARKVAETYVIQRALRKNKNISDAAKALGITRPTLYNLISKYKLEEFK